MFYFLFFDASFASSFELTHTDGTKSIYELKPHDNLYRKLCWVFVWDNYSLWIEDSIEDLVSKIEITVDNNELTNDYFRINYLHKSITPDGKRIQVQKEIIPFELETGFVFKNIKEFGIPPMKKSQLTPMFLNTIMLSYGYYWIETNFAKCEMDYLKSIFKNLDTKVQRENKEKLERWRNIGKQYMKRLQNPVHIKDFYWIRMQRDLKIDYEYFAKEKVFQEEEEDNESEIDTTQYDIFESNDKKQTHSEDEYNSTQSSEKQYLNYYDDSDYQPWRKYYQKNDKYQNNDYYFDETPPRKKKDTIYHRPYYQRYYNDYYQW